jgi:hypothetical protein
MFDRCHHNHKLSTSTTLMNRERNRTQAAILVGMEEIVSNPQSVKISTSRTVVANLCPLVTTARALDLLIRSPASHINVRYLVPLVHFAASARLRVIQIATWKAARLIVIRHNFLSRIATTAFIACDCSMSRRKSSLSRVSGGLVSPLRTKPATHPFLNNYPLRVSFFCIYRARTNEDSS